ncbi:MarR family winged helix-turn-helix transcriptional regulator [Actinoplanes derwentensis]|uniref:DNA-binding transcriptional regulator, MarR family n=1 Tax=Actinoplanes derwentensis TaxID=113562 RepID=A0A1H1SW66_9ACTN|nr:MarR family transcriptional regulator [Actinoplanes derwentensis]GID90058.1 MarR family transcriptional regulator [Actinoplanes derwentensis]SDS52171.1 DNA-binding transcriptional regulator, MarR family [Actinoplanes derwentensis]
MRDEVDRIQQQWRLSRPDLDVGPAGVFLRIMRISRLVHQHADAALAEHGVDRAGFEVLSVIVRAGRPVPPAQIADDLHLTRAGITKRVRQIEAAGLIVRYPHGQDGRSVMLDVTERGRAVVAPALEAIQRLESSWLAELPAEDQAVLEPALRRLLATLQSSSVDVGGTG